MNKTSGDQLLEIVTMAKAVSERFGLLYDEVLNVMLRASLEHAKNDTKL